MKPRVWRQDERQWFVRVDCLHYDIGPFIEWSAAYRYLLMIVKGL